MDPLHDEIYNNQTPTNHISSSFTYLQSVLSVYHLNKYRALRSTCRLSASFVFEEHRASKLASCLRAELLNETTTSCLSACSIEVKESKTHSSHAHLRFWKNFMTCCNGVLCMAASSPKLSNNNRQHRSFGINRHIFRWWLGCPITSETLVSWVPLSFSEGEPGSLGNISCKTSWTAGKSPRQTNWREGQLVKPNMPIFPIMFVPGRLMCLFPEC